MFTPRAHKGNTRILMSAVASRISKQDQNQWDVGRWHHVLKHTLKKTKQNNGFVQTSISTVLETQPGKAVTQSWPAGQLAQILFQCSVTSSSRVLWWLINHLRDYACFSWNIIINVAPGPSLNLINHVFLQCHSFATKEKDQKNEHMGEGVFSDTWLTLLKFNTSHVMINLNKL